MMATELAEYFVSLGIPFRRAHKVVGKLVRFCGEKGLKLEELPLEVIREHLPECGPEVSSRLRPEVVLERTEPGSTGRASIRNQLECWKKRLADPA